MLKLYHVCLPVNALLGYDSYSEFVVAAHSKDEARNTHPSGSNNNWKWDGQWIKPNMIDVLIVNEWYCFFRHSTWKCNCS